MTHPGRARAPLRIAFWGNFGTLNLGNECTLAAALHNVRERLPDAQLTVICREPADTARRHGSRAVHLQARRGNDSRGRRSALTRALCRVSSELLGWLAAAREAGRQDAILITGTGVVTDAGEGPLGLPYELFKWALVTRLRGRKLLFLNVGVESIDRRLSRFLLKAALRLAPYRSYRDAHSVARLREIGFDATADSIRPDLAFSLPRPPRPHPTTHGQGSEVAVGLFNYRGRGAAGAQDAAAYERYLQCMAELVQWLQGQGHRVRLIIGDADYDLPVNADLVERLRGLGAQGVLADPADSYETLLQQLAGVDYVIASRFHNVLLALLLGKLVISVSYEGKNEALMQEVGLGEFCQTLDTLDPERLRRQFSSLSASTGEVRACVTAKVAENAKLLAEQYDLIVGTVARP